MTATVLSLGGGLDSFAMLIGALERGERPDVVAFVDVGHPDDPGEWPSTYRHIDEVVKPLCARAGIEFVTIDHERYPVREARSLFAWLSARNQIPVAGPARICTRIAKVERFEAWLRDRYGDAPVEVWIGFDAAETGRVANDPNVGKATQRRNRFPLVEWGLCRCRCEALVRRWGYPVPRKSACVFCPYGTRGDWQTFAAELPDLYARVVAMEAKKHARLTKNGRRLTIMAYSSKKQRGELLPVYVSKPYRPKVVPCTVCGAAQRATKAAGCDYLDEPIARAA